MKRSLTLSLCAVALAAIGISAAQAAVNVALNLTYTDPADPNDGGTWTLVAKSDDPNSNGITGLAVRLLDMPASGVVDSSIGHDINGGVLKIGTFGSTTEFVYGQNPGTDPNTDPAPLGLIANVGLVTGPSNQGVDPLDVQGFGAGTWNNASVIATGSFTDLSTRPTFDPNSPTAANVDISGTIVAATVNLTLVRGDSLFTLGLESPGGSGLLPGDADRDNDVDIADLGNLAGSLPGGVGGWNDGDTDGDGDVDIADLGALAGSLAASPGTPPAIGAVPEPSTALLAVFGLAAVAWRRRRS